MLIFNVFFNRSLIHKAARQIVSHYSKTIPSNGSHYYTLGFTDHCIYLTEQSMALNIFYTE